MRLPLQTYLYSTAAAAVVQSRFVQCVISRHFVCDKRGVFQELSEPNRACLVGVYAFLIWNNLCDLVYQTPTKSYQRHIPVAFGIPDHVTYQTPTRHALLGSGSS